MTEPQSLQEEIDRLTELNRRLANQIVGMTDRLETSRRELMAQGWDAAVAAMRYEDGSPVEVAANQNPYRQPINPLGDTQ